MSQHNPPEEIPPLPPRWMDLLAPPSVEEHLPKDLRSGNDWRHEYRRNVPAGRAPRQLTQEDLAAVRLAFDRAGKHIGTLMESMIPMMAELGKQFAVIAGEFKRAVEAIERAKPAEESVTPERPE